MGRCIHGVMPRSTSPRATASILSRNPVPVRIQKRERGVERVVVGGLATEYCVLNTAADALRNGFGVLLVEDAIRAIDDADGQRAIDSLRDQGAKMGDSGAILNG